MGNGGDRANLLAVHTNDAAGPVYRNGIKGGDKTGLLRANGHTSPTFEAGVPINDENERLSFWHGCLLDFAKRGARMKIAGQGFMQLLVLPGKVRLAKDGRFEPV